MRFFLSAPAARTPLPYTDAIAGTIAADDTTPTTRT